MAINRSPLGAQVNGFLLQVQDPNEGTKLFKDYIRVPGLASVTLPAETGANNEITLMDGTVSAASFVGVGTISGSVGALGVHPSHQFMEQRSIDQKEVQCNLIRLAVNVLSLDLAKEIFSLVDVSADKKLINIPSSSRNSVRSAVRAGSLIALAAPAASPAKTTSNSVVAYDADASAANDILWQVCLEVEADGSKIWVSPGFSADVDMTAAFGSILQVRKPGRAYTNVLATVSQWDRGDYQNGQVVAGNYTLVPSSILPAVTPEGRITISLDPA